MTRLFIVCLAIFGGFIFLHVLSNFGLHGLFYTAFVVGGQAISWIVICTMLIGYIAVKATR